MSGASSVPAVKPEKSSSMSTSQSLAVILLGWALVFNGVAAKRGFTVGRKVILPFTTFSDLVFLTNFTGLSALADTQTADSNNDIAIDLM